MSNTKTPVRLFAGHVTASYDLRYGNTETELAIQQVEDELNRQVDSKNLDLTCQTAPFSDDLSDSTGEPYKVIAKVDLWRSAPTN